MNFHDLLINRNEIEEALGLSIQTNSEYEYLNDYSMYEYLDLKDVVCIFLNIHPQNINYYQHPRYDLIYDAIKEAIQNKSINGIIEVVTDYYGNESGQRIKITHDVARAWANTYKLNWDVPPYKKIHIDELKPVADNPLQTENASLKAQLEQQAQQIADLQSQLENLKKPDTQVVENGGNIENPIVNYDDFSIYGHSTDEIKAIFKVIQRYWINTDPSDPDTVENADTITEWITKEMPSISQTNASAIQKMTRPLWAKYVGSKGRNKKGI